MEKETPARFDRREKRFWLVAVLAAALCVGLAFGFAVPLRAEPHGASAASVTLADAARVDLNTASVQALCTLEGIGESKARALVEYRLEHGPFASVSEAAQVPGITQATVNAWGSLAYVS